MVIVLMERVFAWMTFVLVLLTLLLKLCAIFLYQFILFLGLSTVLVICILHILMARLVTWVRWWAVTARMANRE